MSTTTVATLQPVLSRRIKAHRKSRQGCGNCKLRKVKCDEIKPRCKRCIGYGVLCDFDGKSSVLQLSADGAFKIQFMHTSPDPLLDSCPNRVLPVLRVQSFDGIEQLDSYQMNENDHELVKKFQMRTVYTISNKYNQSIYQNEMLQLACTHPYLAHSILTMVIMHDRCLTSTTAPLSATEAFHWYRSASLFRDKLSGAVQPTDRDPLFLTAMCLGIISFAFVEARVPEEAWPLKPPSSSDLGWLKMFDGKKDVWKVCGPPIGKSLVDSMFPDKFKEELLPDEPDLGALPVEIIKFLGLGHPVLGDDPYLPVALSLAQILHSDGIMPIIFGFLSFTGKMSVEFRALLKQKDVRALLLLAYWYAKLCQFPHWWTTPRAAMEGQAICIFIGRSCLDDPSVLSLLQYPNALFEKYCRSIYR